VRTICIIWRAVFFSGLSSLSQTQLSKPVFGSLPCFTWQKSHLTPSEAETKFRDFNNADAVIGTGPFVLKSYEKGVRVVFERNPSYFVKGVPYLDGVVLEITPDAVARLALLRSGKVEQAHIWGWLSPEEGKSLQKTNPEMVVTPTLVIGQGFIYMRTDQPPFNDVRVRRALGLALDQWKGAPALAKIANDTRATSGADDQDSVTSGNENERD